MLPPTDNFQFNLRLFKRPGAPPPAPGLGAQTSGPQSRTQPVSAPTPLVGATQGTTSSLPGNEKRLTYYEINLSEGDVYIDGGGYLGSQRYAWIWSTVVGALITFFVSLGGTANPSFATALGLSLLRPYSNDDNYTDAGSPLTWSGRRRVRWNVDKACGIFSGQTKLRLGKTGNSLSRGCIFFLISWAAWYWRVALRAALAFDKPIDAATWVKWVAVVLEAHAALWMFLGAYFYYIRRVFSVVVVNVIAGVHVTLVTMMMVDTLKSGKGYPRLFYVSEAFTITGCMITGQTFVGAGSEHVYVHHAVTLYWSHIVAASCFTYVR